MFERVQVPGRFVAVAVSIVVLVLTSCSSGESDSSGSDASTTTTAQSPRPSGSFTVIAYNVAGLPAEISKENPTEHIPLISPLLDEYDIVLTQEDFDWWGDVAGQSDFVNYHDRLRAQATHPYKTAKHPGPEAVGLAPDRPAPFIGDGQGIMSRFEFTGEQRVPWAGCFGGLDTSDGGAADCASMKGFAVVTVTIAPRVFVDVYSLHVEAGGTATDQALQQSDMDQLAQFIATHSGGRAVIVGGDTNLHTDSDHPDGANGADTAIWAAFLEETGLTDACAATECDDTDRIDKVAFRSGDGVDLAATGYDVPAERFVDDAGDALSDHEPLVVDMTWTATD